MFSVQPPDCVLHDLQQVARGKEKSSLHPTYMPSLVPSVHHTLPYLVGLRQCARSVAFLGLAEMAIHLGHKHGVSVSKRVSFSFS